LNVFRNKLMFFACSAVVTAALVILGIFMLLIVNIDSGIEALSEKPQIQLYCQYDLSEGEVQALEDELRQEPGIREFIYVSKTEAFDKARELLGENMDVLDGFDESFLPVSFIVRMEDPEGIEEFVRKAEVMEGVEKVFYPKDTIDVIVGFSRWVKILSVVLVAIPMAFAFFIMTNTIKLAVTERKSEISIMRYIGATEELIKWPFVIEGVIIGLIGAAIAFMITGHGYSLVERTISSEISSVQDDIFRMVKIGNVSPFLLLIYMVIGVGVGAMGSMRSVRKYLRV